MAASIPGQERTPKRFFRRLLPFYSSFLVLGGVGGQNKTILHDFYARFGTDEQIWCIFFGGETIWHEIPIVGGKWQQLAFPLIEDDLRPSSTMQDLAISEEERDFVRKLQSGTQMGCI